MEITPRKQPRQQRSRATVDAILDATAQVLVRQGYDRCSTNRIAKVAGVSVGSLYQYFPNKQALVMAVAERHARNMIELLGETLSQLGDAPIPIAVRTYVKAMVRAHAVEPELHHALVQLVLQVGLDQFREVDEIAQQIIVGYLETRRDEILPRDLRMAAWVLITTVESLTHVAALKRPEFLQEDMLTAEISNIVLRYLLGEAPAV